MSIAQQIALRPLWFLGELGLGKPVAKTALAFMRHRRARVMHRALASYEPRTQDVFVATYAKSGTNWMLQIVTQLAHNGDAEFEHIHDLCPWPDAPFTQGTATLHDTSTSPTGLRAVKTHLPTQHVPLGPKAKYIIVVRDPKDAFVSGYHFAHSVIRSMLDTGFTPDEWLEKFLDDRPFIFDGWAEFTASWWAVRDEPNVLWITFDELKQDLPGSVRRVANHMGIHPSDAALAKVIERSGFAWMKEHEAQFSPVFPQFRSEKAVMIREGKSGQSKQFLTTDQGLAIDTFCRNGLLKLHSDLPYDEMFSPERDGPTG